MEHGPTMIDALATQDDVFFHSKVFGYEWVRKNYCMSLFWREKSSRIPAAFMTWLTVITTCPTNSTGPKDIQPLTWLEQGVKKEPFQRWKNTLNHTYSRS